MVGRGSAVLSLIGYLTPERRCLFGREAASFWSKIPRDGHIKDVSGAAHFPGGGEGGRMAQLKKVEQGARHEFW